MREIVHIQAGQCGNQIGAKVNIIVLSFFFFLFFFVVTRQARQKHGVRGDQLPSFVSNDDRRFAADFFGFPTFFVRRYDASPPVDYFVVADAGAPSIIVT